jgi:polar amino acid transport system substrate-binding protein
LYIRNAVGLVVIGLTLFGASTKPLHADAIRAATDEWPPFRILTDEGFTGLDLDLIHEVGKRIGTEIDVVRMPWGRGWRPCKPGRSMS